jgi:uncharacterized iron-regulated membrane protein
MHFLTLAHRWMGVVLCLFFAAWFLSGAVLIYHPFPSLSQADRLSQSSDVDLQKILISPFEVVKSIESLKFDRLRLIDLEGQPIYVLHSFSGGIKTVNASDGKLISPLLKVSAGRIAEKFSGSSALNIEGPLNYDQWIVPNRYDPYRPFFRVSMHDEKKTVLYVSAQTGEVLQKTEGKERAWNYIGAVVHWIYPTILRSNWSLWDQVVWWLSLAGVVTTLIGLLLGVMRSRGARNEDRMYISSPFKGWLRVHHILGVFAGIIVLAWIFSGWLSMDHGRIFSKPNPDTSKIKKYRALSLEQSVESVSLEGLKSLRNFVEVEFVSVGGQNFILASNSNGLKLFKPPNSFSQYKLTEPEISSAVQKAWPGIDIQSTQRPTESDTYGQLRERSLPQNTLRVILDDSSQTWIHINMDSGQIVSVMDRSRRVYRWLFNGLHSLDFPGLVSHRPLWDILILLLLGLGFLFSLTGVVVGWKRLSSK